MLNEENYFDEFFDNFTPTDRLEFFQPFKGANSKQSVDYYIRLLEPMSQGVIWRHHSGRKAVDCQANHDDVSPEDTCYYCKQGWDRSQYWRWKIEIVFDGRERGAANHGAKYRFDMPERLITIMKKFHQMGVNLKKDILVLKCKRVDMDGNKVRATSYTESHFITDEQFQEKKQYFDKFLKEELDWETGQNLSGM